MSKTIHLVKLSVGTESVEDLQKWQNTRKASTRGAALRHVTRMWPKRGEEILAGGSIFWVIKGIIQARQVILGLDEVIGSDGIRRCGIVLDPEIIRTQHALRRPFQGWRYLTCDDAPDDLPRGRQSEEPLPVALSAALADIGVR